MSVVHWRSNEDRMCVCMGGSPVSSLLESMLLDDALIMRLNDTARPLAPNLLAKDQLLKKASLKPC